MLYMFLNRIKAFPNPNQYYMYMKQNFVKRGFCN